MRTLIVLIGAALTACAVQSSATPTYVGFDTATLVKTCRSADRGGAACAGFITATAAATEMALPRSCTGERAKSPGAIVAAVVDYYERHPERAAQPAPQGVAEALAFYFPCG